MKTPFQLLRWDSAGHQDAAIYKEAHMTAKISLLVVAMGLTMGSVAYVSNGNAASAQHTISHIAYTMP